MPGDNPSRVVTWRLTMVTFKFFGSQGDEGHPPMLWSVAESSEEPGFDVLESHDNGVTWGVNCTYPTEQAAWDFIAAWFQQFYI
jgi:hypothetical protein